MKLSYFLRIPLPSILGRRKRTSKCVGPKAKAPKVITWDRTIVCLPSSYVESLKSSDIPIPRKKRSILAANGLIGKIHLESDWTEEEVFAEIRSVFSSAMGDDSTFPFTILLPTGSGTKTLAIPSPSSSYKWTPKEVAGRADSSIYILAENKLNNEVCEIHLKYVMFSIFGVLCSMLLRLSCMVRKK